jgi:hypothetical protein
MKRMQNIEKYINKLNEANYCQDIEIPTTFEKTYQLLFQNLPKKESTYVMASYLKYRLKQSYRFIVGEKFSDRFMLDVNQFSMKEYKSLFDFELPFDHGMFVLEHQFKSFTAILLVSKCDFKIDGHLVNNVTIYTYKNKEVTLMNNFLISIGKFPRIYIACPLTNKHCPHMNLSSITDNCEHTLNYNELKLCMKTRNTSGNCLNFEKNLNGLTHADICFSFLPLIKNMAFKINKKKELVFKKVVLKKHELIGNPEVRKYIYFGEKNIQYLNKPKQKGSNKVGRPKKQHIRREHTRTLASGKVVKVKACHVAKKKPKTVYRIT